MLNLHVANFHIVNAAVSMLQYRVSRELKNIYYKRYFTIGIFNWTAILGTSYSRLKAVRWTKATVTMAVTQTVAHPVTIAIIRASFTARYGCSQIRYRHTFLIHAHLNDTQTKIIII